MDGFFRKNFTSPSGKPDSIEYQQLSTVIHGYVAVIEFHGNGIAEIADYPTANGVVRLVKHGAAAADYLGYFFIFHGSLYHDGSTISSILP